MKPFLLLFLITFWGFACDKEEDLITPPDESKTYFPPLSGTAWETTSPTTLDWDAEALESLFSFLEENNTRAFIILKDGKIVIEEYWGKNILNIADFGRNTNWYWASAGKTLTAFLVGLAQEEGNLNIQNKSSDYLGRAWTSLAPEKEDLITVRHQLSMTTGLDFRVDDIYCTDPECLQYRADAGTQWFYHNAPYTLLDQVVSNATGIDYNSYTNQMLERKIGMSGDWVPNGYNNTYWSTPRDMARFGLLIINQGDWDGESIMADKDYYEEMVTTSQSLNPSYGYLWWLNGQSSVIYPGLGLSFNTSVAPQAPAELFSAMGKNGQFIDILPSEGIVVVRMGEAPDGSLVPVQFHDDMWGLLEKVIR